MKKIKTISDIPDWFNLDNYSYLDTADATEIYDALEDRGQWVSGLNSPSVVAQKDAELITKMIKLGKKTTERYKGYKQSPFITKFDRVVTEIETVERLDLGGGGLVEPLSCNHLDKLYSTMINELPKVEEYKQRQSEITKTLLEMENRNSTGNSKLYLNEIALWDCPVDAVFNEKNIKPFREKSIHISLDLAGGSDEQILEELSKLLPKWRQRLVIPEPDLPKIRTNDLNKIVGNKIIPLIDLICISSLEGYSITNAVLARILHPTGDRGEIQLTQTDIPFSHKVLTLEYRKSLSEKIL
ncbi:hypothetical protein KO525_18650 [Psychrosphaera sp. B3R10]|uniref:DUF6387 family protein n=1 Tax=unclassified Psychrosphaera TaxID=2641570 RepID=UPI001C09CAF9|nr:MULTISPECIES: DUF6387 family protein [unclassified Psychrosphaera]MBU2883009.1 hypothetical protein [Psychrosphaera sp. I2R16]MBU2991406.1 hypothetical protein [Psychrosphaera sp. B3R10]